MAVLEVQQNKEINNRSEFLQFRPVVVCMDMMAFHTFVDSIRKETAIYEIFRDEAHHH